MKENKKAGVPAAGIIRAVGGLAVSVMIILSPWWLCKGPLSQAASTLSMLSAAYTIDGMTVKVSPTDIEEPQEEKAEETAPVEEVKQLEPDDSMPTETQPTQSTQPTQQAEEQPSEQQTPLKPVLEKQYGGDGTSFEGVYVRNGSNGNIDIEKLLNESPDCKIKLNAGYQVLIVHTHTTESYGSGEEWYDPSASPRTTDLSQSVVSVGEAIAARLEEAGIRTLHITTMHDYPNYNGAYTRAAQTIAEALEENPSIEMVIDVHRDCIEQSDGTRIKPTAQINGKKAAQVMILNGCCVGKDLEFDSWEMNLRMGLRLQKQLGEDWPGLARSLYVAPFRYNMNMTPNSMIIEVGSDVNALEEAVYSGDMVGQSLAKVLLQYVV